MSRYRCACYLLLMLTLQMPLALSGCGRAAPHEPDETKPAPAVLGGEKQIPPVPGNGPAAAPGVAIASSNALNGMPANATTSRIVAPVDAATQSWIGPGHFTGSRETVISHLRGVRALEVSPDGKFVAGRRHINHKSGLLQLWDVSTAILIRETLEPSGITTVAFAPDSQSLAYGAGDHSVVIQSLPTGPATRLNGHILSILDLAYSPDGKRLVSSGLDKRMILWDTGSRTLINETIIDGPRPAWRVRFMSSERLWTWAEDGTLRWYGIQADVPKLDQQVKLAADFRPVVTDASRLYALQSDQTMRTIDAATGRELPALLLGGPPARAPETAPETAPEASPVAAAGAGSVEGRPPVRPFITAIAVASSSRDLAVCSSDGKFTLWEKGVPTARRTASINAEHVSHLAADEQGRLWAGQTGGDGLFVIDRDHPEALRWLQQPINEAPGQPIASRFGPRGETVVTALNSQTLSLSQIETGLPTQRFQRLDPSNANAVSVLLAGHGSVICGTITGTVEFWKPESTAPVSISVGKAAITALAESLDGQLLLVGDAEGATSWLHSQASSSLRQGKQSARIGAAAVSVDGRWAATGSDDHTIVLWDASSQSPTQTLQGHNHPLTAIAFTSDSQSLISGDTFGTVIAWDIPSGRQQWSVTLPPFMTQSQYRPQAPLLDPAGTDVSTSVVGPPPAGTALNPDAGAAATSIKSKEAPSPVKSTAAAAAKPPRRDSHVVASGISAFALSPNQRVLAVGTATGYTQTFDPKQGRKLSAVYHHAPISDLSFSADGAALLVATLPGDVSRWSQAPSAPRPLVGHHGSVRFAALDASGQSAVTGGVDKRFCVWNVDQGTLLQAIENEGEAIVSGALSADGRRAVTGSYGSGIVFWDLLTMKRLAKRYGHGKRVLSLAFSPDGGRVASGSEDHTVRVWDYSTQKTKYTIPHDAAVHFVTFSPDGTKLVTSTLDARGWQFAGRLQLWDAATGKPLVEFQGHRVVANAAVFSPDGTQLTSCGADGHVCRWIVQSGQRTYEGFRSDGLSHAGLINDGQSLVMRRFNKGVIIQSLETMTRQYEFDVPTRSVGDLGVASRGNRIIAGTEEGLVYVWSVRNE